MKNEWPVVTFARDSATSYRGPTADNQIYESFAKVGIQIDRGVYRFSSRTLFLFARTTCRVW